MCLLVILAAGPVLLSYLSQKETGQKHAKMLLEDKEETNHIGFLVNLLLEHTAKQAITKSQCHVTAFISHSVGPLRVSWSKPDSGQLTGEVLLREFLLLLLGQAQTCSSHSDVRSLLKGTWNWQVIISASVLLAKGRHKADLKVKVWESILCAWWGHGKNVNAENGEALRAQMQPITLRVREDFLWKGQMTWSQEDERRVSLGFWNDIATEGGETSVVDEHDVWENISN